MFNTSPGVRLKAIPWRSVGTKSPLAAVPMPRSLSLLGLSRLSRALEIFCAAEYRPELS